MSVFFGGLLWAVILMIGTPIAMFLDALRAVRRK